MMEKETYHTADLDSDLQNLTDIKGEPCQISAINLSGKSPLKFNSKRKVLSNSREQYTSGHNQAVKPNVDVNSKDQQNKQLVSSYVSNFENDLLHDYCAVPKHDLKGDGKDCKADLYEDSTGIDIGFSSDQTTQWIRNIIQTEKQDSSSLDMKEEINDASSSSFDRCDLVFSSRDFHESHLQSQHDEGEVDRDPVGSFRVELNLDNLSEDALDSLAEENLVVYTGLCDSDGLISEHDSVLSMKKRLRKKRYKCIECNESFMKKKDLQVHMTIHNDNSPFKCSECKKCFMHRKDLKMHFKIHTGERLFTCPECNQSFNTKWNLNTHIRLHSGEKPFTCNECNQSFNTKWNLQIHVKRRHSGNKLHKCKHCDQKFTSKSDLNVHKIMHSGKKTFKCCKCDKTFNSNNKLRIHVRTHTGEKSFNCTECGKDFSHSRHLQSHMMKHTGESPFTCKECDKTFSDQGNLKRHMRKHTGEKPFQCSQCDKFFRDSSNLNRHMITHTGERPFKCSECDQGFTSKWNMNTHMKLHSGEKPFICSECRHSFHTKGNLLVHMKRRHSKEK